MKLVPIVSEESDVLRDKLLFLESWQVTVKYSEQGNLETIFHFENMHLNKVLWLLEWVNVQEYKTQDSILWPEGILLQKREILLTSFFFFYDVTSKIETTLCCISSAKNIFQSWVYRGTAAIVPCSIRKTVMVSANIRIQLNSAFYLELTSFYYIPTVCTSSILFQHYSSLKLSPFLLQ